jgi:quercetin dioxygenase-like cupin family protein
MREPCIGLLKGGEMRLTYMTGVVIAVVVAVIMTFTSSASATPAAGFTSTTIALGRFGSIDVANSLFPDGFFNSLRTGNFWISLQKTHGDSDLYVQSNVWAPGGTTGWHTHPGHSLITVTAGAVTAYEGDDPSCAPHIYTQGMGFVDPGHNHVHVIRNEGAIEARTITVQLIPAGATRRIDVAAGPSACPF